MKIAYTIHYDKFLFTSMWIGYCLFVRRVFLIGASVALFILWLLLHANPYNKIFDIYFYMGLALVLSELATYARVLIEGYRRIAKYGDDLVDYLLNEESVIFTSKLMKIEYSWDFISCIIDMKSYSLLIVNKHQGYVPVPKKVLTPEIDAWLDSKVLRRKAKSRSMLRKQADAKTSDTIN